MTEYHAELSPSSSPRWLTCPGSVILSRGVEDKGSVHAAEGSAAHEVASMALTSSNAAAAYVGRLIEVKGAEMPVTAEMAGFVQIYVDAVRARCQEYELRGATVLLEVEQRVPIGHITREPGAEGTADVIIIAEWSDGTATIDCWDLKYGRGVAVQAERNEQGMLYCLGAIEKFGILYTFRDARITIHQPRLSAKPDDWEVGVEELQAFAKQVTQAAHLVKAAQHCRDGGGIDFAEKYLQPSEKGCRFCKAKGATNPDGSFVCQALAQHVSTVVLDDFDVIESPEQVEAATAQVKHRSDLNLAAAMGAVDQIEDWCKAVRAETERRLLEAGNDPALVEALGHKLVQGRQGPRAWADKAEAEAMLKAMRLKVEEMYELSVISPTTAEKLTKAAGDAKPLIGPRQWPKLESLITRSKPKPSVAPISDKRPALVITPVIDEFTDISQEEAIA